jgi:hypothetical protein
LFIGDILQLLQPDDFTICILKVLLTALRWMPKQKRARGRLNKNWMEEIRKAMNERN